MRYRKRRATTTDSIIWAGLVGFIIGVLMMVVGVLREVGPIHADDVAIIVTVER